MYEVTIKSIGVAGRSGEGVARTHMFANAIVFHNFSEAAEKPLASEITVQGNFERYVLNPEKNVSVVIRTNLGIELFDDVWIAQGDVFVNQGTHKVRIPEE